MWVVNRKLVYFIQDFLFTGFQRHVIKTIVSVSLNQWVNGLVQVLAHYDQYAYKHILTRMQHPLSFK